MNRLLTSRKLWGALLGSICVIITVKLAPESVAGNALLVLGGLWGAAIGGQAYSDVLKEKKNQVD